MTPHAIFGRSTNGGRPLFSIITALCLMIMYAPGLYLLLASLNPDEQLGLVAPTRYSLTWYVALLDDHRLFMALEESAVVGLATAALATPAGLAAAGSLAGLRPGRPSRLAAGTNGRFPGRWPSAPP